MHSNSFNQTFNEESLSHEKEEEKGDGGVLAPPALFSSSFPYSVCCYPPFSPSLAPFLPPFPPHSSLNPFLLPLRLM